MLAEDNIQCACCECFVVVFSVGVSRDKGRSVWHSPTCICCRNQGSGQARSVSGRRMAWRAPSDWLRKARRATPSGSRHRQLPQLSAGTHAATPEAGSQLELRVFPLRNAANVVMVTSLGCVCASSMSLHQHRDPAQRHSWRHARCAVRGPLPLLRDQPRPWAIDQPPKPPCVRTPSSHWSYQYCAGLPNVAINLAPIFAIACPSLQQHTFAGLRK